MKVIFIYTNAEIQSMSRPLRTWTNIPLGISYISSVLKVHGHQTQSLVLGSNKFRGCLQLLNSMMETFNPGLVCFTAVASQYPFIEKIASFMKKQWPHKFLIIGGVHATLNPDEVIKGAFNALCIGEGEYPLLELCNQLEDKHTPEGIANLWIKSDDGTIQKNLTRPFLQNLDILPFPDREMWKPCVSGEQRFSEWSVLVGRGCPYNCTYCSNHVLRKIASGKYVRMRSAKNIVQEIASIHEKFPECQRIFLEVEAIALDKTWTLELCKQLEAFNPTINNSISYGCNFRISPQSVDEKLFIALEKANFQKINIGLESGNERVRREVLKRNYSNQDFLNAVSLARKHSLKVNVFNMIGIPGETLNDHMDTVLLNRQCQPDTHYTGISFPSIFFPYPGTELYNMCIKQGLIKDQVHTKMERYQAVMDLPGFTKAEIQSAYTWFNYRVYKGHKPLLKLLIQVIVAKARSNPTSNFLLHIIWRILGPVRKWLI